MIQGDLLGERTGSHNFSVIQRIIKLQLSCRCTLKTEMLRLRGQIGPSLRGQNIHLCLCLVTLASSLKFGLALGSEGLISFNINAIVVVVAAAAADVVAVVS